MSRRRANSSKKHLAFGLLAIAGVLHMFSCSWSTNYFEASPTAIVGIPNMIGVYARHARHEDLMLGIIIPSTLVCVGAYLSRDDK